MTSRILLLAGVAVLAATASLKAQTISLFGNTAASGGGWTYTPGTSTISGTENAGYLIFGSPANINLGSNRYISLTGNATTAPAGNFTITLEDDASHLVFAQFKWADFTGGSTKVAIINNTGSFNFSHITGWSLDSGGSQQAVTASFSQLSAVAAIPEPSTWVLATAGLLLCVHRGFRRRRI